MCVKTKKGDWRYLEIRRSKSKGEEGEEGGKLDALESISTGFNIAEISFSFLFYY